jgi:predicted nucleic acid-binding protein
MEPFVLDASLTLSWCFADEETPYSRDVLASLETTYAVVPALWPFEVVSVLALAERKRRITQEGIEEFLDMLRRLPIQIERREALWLWQAILPLVREHRLSAYDAAYLELAKRERMCLATLDQALQEASRTAGVPILEVSVS